jgi:hypothetical protein
MTGCNNPVQDASFCMAVLEVIIRKWELDMVDCQCIIDFVSLDDRHPVLSNYFWDGNWFVLGGSEVAGWLIWLERKFIHLNP